MLLIWGTSVSVVPHGKTTQYCPRCREQTNHTSETWIKRFSLFFIPLFETGRDTVMRCNRCSSASERNRLLSNARRRTWIGGVLIAISAFPLYFALTEALGSGASQGGSDGLLFFACLMGLPGALFLYLASRDKKTAAAIASD
jgi:hypothetical protein